MQADTLRATETTTTAGPAAAAPAPAPAAATSTMAPAATAAAASSSSSSQPSSATSSSSPEGGAKAGDNGAVEQRNGVRREDHSSTAANGKAGAGHAEQKASADSALHRGEESSAGNTSAKTGGAEPAGDASLSSGVGAGDEPPAAKDNVKRSWRVKVYRLDSESRWIDEGTGMVEIKYLPRINGNAIQVTADHENETPGKIILESAIVAEDIYQPQGKMIITWSEPTNNMELAISFEEQAGCEFILDQLCQIQGKVSADFHGAPRLGQGDYGANYRGGSGSSIGGGRDGEGDSGDSFPENMERCELPDPEVENLDRIADLLANMNPVHREGYLSAIQAPYRPSSKKSKKKRRRANAASRKRPRARAANAVDDQRGVVADHADGDHPRSQQPQQQPQQQDGHDVRGRERTAAGDPATDDGGNQDKQAQAQPQQQQQQQISREEKDANCGGSTGSSSSSSTASTPLDMEEQHGEDRGGGSTPSLDDEGASRSSSGCEEDRSEADGDQGRITYLRALLNLFHECEHKGDMRSLHTLNTIIRTLVLYNEPVFLEEILSDEYFEDIVGVLEYDPEVKPKPDHREFLRKHVQHKMVVPIEDPETLRKVHQSFRIRFFRDAVMPRTLDEATAGIISDMDASNGIHIASSLHMDAHYLHNIFDLLRSPDTPVEKRSDAVGCLQELCSLAKKMQVPSRNAFYRSLMKKGDNFFGIFERILGDPKSTVQERLNIGDILKLALDHDPTQLRSFILLEKSQPQSPHVRATDVLNKLLNDSHTSVQVKLQMQMDLFAQPGAPREGERPPLSLMAQLLKRLVFDAEAGMQAQAMEILRMLLDPETMEAAEKENFLTLFYDHYIAWLVLPLEMVRVRRKEVPGPAAGGPAQAQAQAPSASLTPAANGPASPPPSAVGYRAPFTSAPRGYELVMCTGLLDAHAATRVQSAEERLMERKAAETARVAELHITELLSFCVQTHGFRIKYFVLNEEIIPKVLRLLYSRDKHLVLGAIRFARTCVGLKDDFYNRHIVKLNLFAPIVEVFVSNGPRNNLINSAIIELLEFVRMEKIRLLIKYIVESFGDKLNSIDYVETYSRLKEAYELNKADSAANGTNAGAAGEAGSHLRLQHQRQGRATLLGISEVPAGPDARANAGPGAGNGSAGNGSAAASGEFDFRPFNEHEWQLAQDEESHFAQRAENAGTADADGANAKKKNDGIADGEGAPSFRMRRASAGNGGAANAIDAMEEDIEEDDDAGSSDGAGSQGFSPNGTRKNKRKAKSLRLVVDTNSFPSKEPKPMASAHASQAAATAGAADAATHSRSAPSTQQPESGAQAQAPAPLVADADADAAAAAGLGTAAAATAAASGSDENSKKPRMG